MKEPTIEENTKVYTELINRLEDVKDAIKKQNYGIAMEILCKPYTPFQVITHSELTESEGERIRKHLIKHFGNKSKEDWNGVPVKSILAWLEKRGEQKLIDKIRLGKKYKCIASPRYSAFTKGLIYQPEDKFLCSLMNFCSDCFEPVEDVEQTSAKVEPRFRVGDTMRTLQEAANGVIDGLPVVISIDNGCYRCNNETIDIKDQDDYEYPPMNRRQKTSGWSEKLIADVFEQVGLAKIVRDQENDAFTEALQSAMIELAKYSVVPQQKQGEQESVVIIPKFRVGDVIRPKGSTAEYTIESISGECYHGKGWGLHISCDDDYELVKQKSADLPKGEDYGIDGLYSAVDILQKTLGKVDGYQTDDGILEHECAISAVKSLYEQKPAWSEEDEEIHRKCICAMRASACGFPEEEKFVEQVDNWLKALKDRVQPQPKNEWDEEDERNLNDTILFIETGTYSLDKDNLIDWLKSLRRQNRWKPSDEMLEALYRATPKCVMEKSEDEILLDKLYQGLKYGRVL